MTTRCNLQINPATPGYKCCLCLSAGEDFTVTLRISWEVGTFHVRCSPEFHCLRLSRFEVSYFKRHWEGPSFLAQHRARFAELVRSPPALLAMHRSETVCRDNVRHLLEVFKYLSYFELGSGVTKVCKLWKGASEHEELWSLSDGDLARVPQQFRQTPKQAVLYQILRTCIHCNAHTDDSHIELVCPRTSRVLCSDCFYRSDIGLQPLGKVAGACSVSKNSLKFAGTRFVLKFQESLVLACEAKKRLMALRETRKLEAIKGLREAGCPEKVVSEVAKLPLSLEAGGSSVASEMAKPFCEYVLSATKRVLKSSFLEQSLSELTSVLPSLRRT